MVKIRLARLGDKKSPFYRVVVADSRRSRDGKFIEVLGTFNPLTNPEEIKIDGDKVKSWMTKGAQPTDTARALLEKAGILEHVQGPKKVYKTAAKKVEE
jgi:small subunit ribosomal protein S16